MSAEIISLRPITRDDLPRLARPRDKLVTTPQRLRNSHHNVARFLAMGQSYTQIAALTGYTPTRIGQLAGAPAMKELVARYREKIDESWADAIDAYTSLAVQNMIAAERQIQDRIDEADAEGETLPIRELVAITSDRADRFGYPKKSVLGTKDLDFAAKLEAAIARSKSPKTIEEPRPAPLAAPAPSPRNAMPALPPLRRIA